ncbi:MAG: hypothetical protein ACYC61_25840, partial [Isosphaeraceae bacterium]
MSKEKRLILFAVLVFLWMISVQYITQFLGLNPPKKPPAPPAAAAKADDAGKKPADDKAAPADVAKEQGKGGSARAGEINAAGDQVKPAGSDAKPAGPDAKPATKPGEPTVTIEPE